MLNKIRLKKLFKKAFTPITIMLIPHSNAKPFKFKMPSIGMFVSIFLWVVGTFYVFSVATKAFEYKLMKDRLKYYSSQFLELNSTIKGLKKTDNDFKKLFSLGSKEKVLEKLDTSGYGNIDIEKLKLQIGETIERVGEIKDYLHLQKNIYLATPRGLPVAGTITSPYGIRKHPITGEEQFHPALDIKESPGSPIRATADGIVSFSGWHGGNGNLVVLEHGFSFSTLYGHTKMNTVKVGQKVKRGDIIGYIGSTGDSTGPHVHYEVWKEGRHVDPKDYN